MRSGGVIFYFILLFLILPTLNLIIFYQYWEKAEFPFHVIPKFAALRIAGGTIKVLYLHILLLRVLVRCKTLQKEFLPSFD